MSFRLPRLAELRLLSEIHFAFGGALIGGVTGLGLAAAALVVAPRAVVADPGFVAHYRRIATGAGVGWIGGLFWCGLLAMNARRHQPPPPTPVLMRATWIAAGSSVVAEAAALYAGVPEGWAVPAALVVATLAARLVVTAGVRRIA
jgi:hypothetical protein